MQKLSDYKMPELISRKGKMNKVLSGVVTAFVIGLLVFLGPVNALQLSINGLDSDNPYIAGEIINFSGTFVIEDQDIPEIKNISLEINGFEACTIDIWGWKYTDCDGVNITLMEYDTSYGYGYGYNQFVEEGNGSYAGYGYSYGYHLGKNRPGRISYNISIDTSNAYIGSEKEGIVSPYLWFGGKNKIKFIVNTAQQELESAEHNVWLNPAVEKGDGNFEFYYPDLDLTLAGTYNSAAKTFEGYLTGGTDKTYYFVGVGEYDPIDSDSGTMTLRLYDNTINNDIGIFWYGNYSDGTWYLSPHPSMEAYVQGKVIAAPQ